MRDTATEHNKEHYAALAIAEAHIKAGGKYIVDDTPTPNPWACDTGSKEKEVVSKSFLRLSPVERFKSVIKKHKRLTRNEVAKYTNVGQNEISRLSSMLAGSGFIRKSQGSKTKQVIYIYVGSK